MYQATRLPRILFACLFTLSLAACGGGGGGGASSAPTGSYHVGGTLAGLAVGGKITLLNHGREALTLTANGTFRFSSTLVAGGSYAVTVGMQPTGQTCTVSSGSGSGISADVSKVSVSCSTDTYTYTVGGTLSGLSSGQQVTLLDNGGDALTVMTNGGFRFTTPVASGGSYAVTVGTQPAGEVCTVSHGAGAGIHADADGVAVFCSAITYTVGGTLSGLGSGQQATLLNNGADALSLTGDGSFRFATPVASGGSYAVTVGTQPTGQTCTVSSGSGSAIGADVSNIGVSCTTDTYTVGGTLSGLGSGQQVTLLDNGGDALTLTANGGFRFATPIDYGGSYAITVGTQPTGSLCSVMHGTGSAVTADVSTVSVSCETAYTVGGEVSGLASGQQVTLLNNGGDPLILSSDGSFTFGTRIAPDAGYAVTVGTQPGGQTCTVNRGVGYGAIADIGDVLVRCSASTYGVGGTLSGLAGGQQLTLLNNGGDALTLTANGRFSFATPAVQGAAYTITVKAQPGGQTCTVTGDTGTAATATTSVVTCSATGYTVSGTVSGLVSGQQLTLLNNDADPQIVTGNGAFSFITPVASGASYIVVMGTQPAAQTCSVSNGDGLAVGADVSNVVVRCRAAEYLYVTNSGDGTVSQYKIGSGGTLSPLSPATVSAGAAPDDIVVDPTGSHAYVTDLHGSDVLQYDINSDGTLRPMTTPSVLAVASPLSISMDPLGHDVYVSSQSAGSIQRFSVAADGSLTAVDTESTATTVNQLAIDPLGRYLYAPSGDSDSIDQYAIGSNGALNPMTPASVSVPPTQAPMQDVVVDPTAHYLYASQFNLNNINSVAELSIGSSGQLSLMSTPSIAPDSQPSGMAVDPAGRCVYVANYLSNDLSAYAIVPGGQLSSLGGSAISTQAAPEIVVVDPTGRYVYVSNRSANTLSQFSIEPGGMLKAMSTAAVSAGNAPEGMAVH